MQKKQPFCRNHAILHLTLNFVRKSILLGSFRAPGDLQTPQNSFTTTQNSLTILTLFPGPAVPPPLGDRPFPRPGGLPTTPDCSKPSQYHPTRSLGTIGDECQITFGIFFIKVHAATFKIEL